MSTRETEYLQGLVTELTGLPVETPWVEFKENNGDPMMIGATISALSNAAALAGKAHAYLVWGVADSSHELTGTTFRPSLAKKGNELLENWLLRLLSPRIHFKWHEFEMEGKPLALLEIPRASTKPTTFSGVESIRVGSCCQKLKDYPEIERELWRIFDKTPFEEIPALVHVSSEDVLALLDYPSYFELVARPVPSEQSAILDALAADRLIVANDASGWDIMNLGAILFAKDLQEFKALARKAIRVIKYQGRGREQAESEQVGKKGYASGFEPLIKFVNRLVPRNEIVAEALRKEVPMYPKLAIRELVANALIHQDCFVSGTGPMIEIFADRIEISNPGEPLVSTDRFLDSPPRSRNESLASLMRRAGVCEERGSGVDKVVSETELYQLPAPLFESPPGSTRVVLFAPKEFRAMDRSDRVRACYLHACLRFVQRDPMTNSSLRERFKIEKQNSSMASRIIRDAIGDELIKPYDPEQGKKHAKYIPHWA